MSKLQVVIVLIEKTFDLSQGLMSENRHSADQPYITQTAQNSIESQGLIIENRHSTFQPCITECYRVKDMLISL